MAKDKKSPWLGQAWPGRSRRGAVTLSPLDSPDGLGGDRGGQAPGRGYFVGMGFLRSGILALEDAVPGPPPRQSWGPRPWGPCQEPEIMEAFLYLGRRVEGGWTGSSLARIELGHWTHGQPWARGR